MNNNEDSSSGSQNNNHHHHNGVQNENVASGDSDMLDDESEFFLMDVIMERIESQRRLTRATVVAGEQSDDDAYDEGDCKKMSMQGDDDDDAKMPAATKEGGKTTDNSYHWWKTQEEEEEDDKEMYAAKQRAAALTTTKVGGAQSGGRRFANLKKASTSSSSSVPGAYSDKPGQQDLVRQYSGRLSSVVPSVTTMTETDLEEGTTRNDYESEDDDKTIISDAGSSSRDEPAEDDTHTIGNHHEGIMGEEQEGNTPTTTTTTSQQQEDTDIEDNGTTTYITSAKLVVEEEPPEQVITTTPPPEEAQPVTNGDMLWHFLRSSIGCLLILLALMFVVGLTCTFLLALFVWPHYEAAFVFAQGLALSILCGVAHGAIAIKLVLLLRRRRNNYGHDDQSSSRIQQQLPVVLLLLLLLLLSAVAAIMVAYGVYWSSQNAQQNMFRSKFDDLAIRLVEGFHDNARLRLRVMDMLAVSITSTALATNQIWPFVTIPDFDARATSARALVGSIYVGLYPYVTNETRSKWEEYTMNNMGWINASHAYSEDFQRRYNRSHSRYHGGGDGDDEPPPLRRRRLGGEFHQAEEDGDNNDYYMAPAPNVSWTGTDGASPKIFRYGRRERGEGYLVVEDSPGPYYPMWQLSPIREATESYVNYNSNDPYLGEAYTAALETVRSTQSAVFGGVWNVDDDGYILEDDDYDTRTVPASAVIYPVFDKIIGENRTVVAVLEFDLEFGPYFSRILPPANSNSLICIVSNPCGQTFSYEVNGASATYLGAYDVVRSDHDNNENNNNAAVSRFDDMEVTSLLTDFQEGMEYNGCAPTNKDYCPWTLTVYPTSELESEFVTDSPLYYTCAVLGVFVLTCAIITIFRVFNNFGKYHHDKEDCLAKSNNRLDASEQPSVPCASSTTVATTASNNGDDAGEAMNHSSDFEVPVQQLPDSSFRTSASIGSCTGATTYSV